LYGVLLLVIPAALGEWCDDPERRTGPTTSGVVTNAENHRPELVMAVTDWQMCAALALLRSTGR
jgi:hypothetical protein